MAVMSVSGKSQSGSLQGTSRYAVRRGLLLLLGVVFALFAIRFIAALVGAGFGFWAGPEKGLGTWIAGAMLMVFFSFICFDWRNGLARK